TPVLVIHFPEQGEATDIVLGGERPTIHTVTITDVSAGVDQPLGSQFDWYCSCRMCSEGLPNGDCHPSIRDAEQDAVWAHEANHKPLITSPVYAGREYPGEDLF